MYTMIQTQAVNANTYAVVELLEGAYKSPAGYIVGGKFRVVDDGLTEEAARRLIRYLNLA